MKATKRPRGRSIEERFCYRGDTVQLQSGGPDMIVVEVNDYRVTCEWVCREVLIERDEFAASELRLVRRA